MQPLNTVLDQDGADGKQKSWNKISVCFVRFILEVSLLQKSCISTQGENVLHRANCWLTYRLTFDLYYTGKLLFLQTHWYFGQLLISLIVILVKCLLCFFLRCYIFGLANCCLELSFFPRSSNFYIFSSILANYSAFLVLTFRFLRANLLLSFF